MKRNKIWKQIVSVLLSISLIVGMITVSNIREAKAADNAQAVRFELTDYSAAGALTFSHTPLDEEYQGNATDWKFVRYQFDAYKDGSTTSESMWIQLVGNEAYIYGNLHYADDKIPTELLYVPEGTIMYECTYENGVCTRVAEGKTLKLERDIKVINAGDATNPHWYQDIAQDFSIWFNGIDANNWWVFGHSELPEVYVGKDDWSGAVKYQYKAYKDNDEDLQTGWLECVGSSINIYPGSFPGETAPTSKFILAEGTILEEYDSVKQTTVENGKRLRLSHTYALRYQNGTWVASAVLDDNNYLVSAGQSEYTILLPENPTAKEQFAAQELQHFFKEATGVKLPVQKEGALELPDKYLSVGNTEASKAANVKPSAEQVRSNGFVIKTVDNDCYIKGYGDMGTRNGVYEWLSQCFDYECYAADCIQITKTTEKKLPNFDLVEVPDFEYREASSELATKATEAYRMQFNSNEELFVTGLRCHNSFMMINPDTYLETHRDWFSTSESNGVPYQLCYSNAEMRAEYVENLKEILKTSTQPMMILGMEDNNFWCECDACQSSENTYGSNAAVMIDFVNEVQSEIAEWYATEHPSQEPVQLVIFAYHQTEQPPTGNITLDSAAGVMYAPVRASYVDSFDADINAKFKQQLEGWNALTDNLYMWTYSYYAQELFIFYDNLDVVKENYAIYQENGARYIYDMMAVANENGNPGWERAKTYVMSKLQWDCSLDVAALLDDFFNNYYEDASEAMKQVYNDNKVHMRDVVLPELDSSAPTDDNFTQVRGNVFVEIIQYVLSGKSQRVAYTDEYVNAAFDDFDTALEAIEKYRYSNPEKYDQLYSRILLERMQFQYIYSRYREGYSWSNYYGALPREEQWQFRIDFEKLGLTTVKETWTAADFWKDIWNMPDYNQVQAIVTEVTEEGEIYLKGEIIEGVTKTLENVYGTTTGIGTIQFEQAGKLITENITWSIRSDYISHGNANIKIVSDNSYIKENLSNIDTFHIRLGETVLFGASTPIYVANDINIGKLGESWVEYNEIELTYTLTTGGYLYLNADFISGPDAGKTMRDAYGDWAAMATGNISYILNGEKKENQTTYFDLFADDINHYNGNVYMRNDEVAQNFAAVSELTIEAGTFLTIMGHAADYSLSTTPLRIANTLHLEKDTDGNWKQDYNVVEVTFDYSDGNGFYFDAEIVSGPNAGDNLTSVYGNWGSVPIGYITYDKNGEDVTMPVIWSTTNDNGKEQIYVSGDYYTDIAQIQSMTFANDTVLIPTETKYSTTPMKLANEVKIYSYKGHWSDKNQITAIIDSFDGTAIYMNVDIVAGPDEGKELSKVYGEWTSYLPTEITCVRDGVKETKQVTWQPCSTYDEATDTAMFNKIYVPIGDITYAGQVTEIIFSNGTVLTPTSDEYSKVPVEFVDNMHLVRTSDAEFLDISMLDVKLQDNYAKAEEGATTFDIRFIASVNHTNYKKVGFVFSLSNEEPEIDGEKCVTRPLTSVYTNMNVGTEKYNVHEIYDGYSNYLFAFGINKVPANQVIYARAYVELPDGRIIYGNVRTVTAPDAK